MSVEAVASIAGAVVVIAFQVYDWNRRRPRFRVTASLSDAQGFGSWNGPGQHHLTIEALNTGERPAVLAWFGYSTGSGRREGWTASGPDHRSQVEPGESLRQILKIEASAIEDPNLISSVWAEDTLGRRYYLRRERLLGIQDELAFAAYRAEMGEQGWLVA